MPWRQTYVVGKKPHSNTIPFFVGPKAIYVSPSCKKFLIELSNVANITIWSALKISTIKSICDLLFEDLPVKPVNILDQKSYNHIRVQDNWKKVLYMKVKETKKNLFMKTTQKHLFL